MNYLAHAFLSAHNKELLVGNFIADHIKGQQFQTYSQGIIEGILMHRQIDTFTDAHANFKTCKKIFYNGFERYSGVLVDMYFDHLLAKNFENHTNKSLGLFAENVYEVYTDYEALMPEKSSRCGSWRQLLLREWRWHSLVQGPRGRGSLFRSRERRGRWW
jgi:acyl carrier protein phosphodiesterase